MLPFQMNLGKLNISFTRKESPIGAFSSEVNQVIFTFYCQKQTAEVTPTFLGKYNNYCFIILLG